MNESVRILFVYAQVKMKSVQTCRRQLENLVVNSEALKRNDRVSTHLSTHSIFHSRTDRQVNVGDVNHKDSTSAESLQRLKSNRKLSSLAFPECFRTREVYFHRDNLGRSYLHTIETPTSAVFFRIEVKEHEKFSWQDAR